MKQWITRVLSRIEHYKTEHQILLKEALTLLELALWKANLHDDAAAAHLTLDVDGHVEFDNCSNCGDLVSD